MANFLDEIKVDVDFVRSHALQPKWYKALKVVILVGFLVGYRYLFGLARTAVFCASFFSLSLLVHLIYRAKTQRRQHSWLDFAVAEENDKTVAKSIGKYYYAVIVLNALLSVVISQALSAICESGAPCPVLSVAGRALAAGAGDRGRQGRVGLRLR